MANEFKVKNGLIVIGDLTTSGTITINGALAATQSWVASQGYLTSASLSGYATQSYVTSAISALIDAAPAALDTLNELAAALGDDANFSTTITNSIAGKMALYNGVGAPDFNTNTTNGIYRNQGGANAPVSGSHFTMFSAFQPDGNYGWQLAASASDSLYFRFKDANFNSWVQLATRSWVTSQNYLTSYTDTLATVTSRGASTSTPVTFNGNVTLGNNADLVFQDLSGTFPTTGKGFDWTLNNDGARIYAVQPGSDSIDLVFQLRDNATTNDRFVFWVDEWQGPAYDKYPLIISGGTEFDLKDSSLYTNSVLRLSNSGVLQNVTGNISMFTNNAGYLTSESDTLATVTGRGATTSTNISVNTINIGTDATYGAAYRSVSFGYNGDGSNRILAANNTSDGMYFMAATGQGFNFRPNGGTANLVVINSTGNVGIGTTSPATPLHVTGGASGSGGWNRTATLAATYPGLIFNSNDTKWGGMAYDYSAAMRFWVNANNDDIFAGTLAMSILNSGNVGIGTTSPGALLDVNGSLGSGKSIIRVTNSDTANYITIGAGIPGISNAGMNLTLDGTSRMVISAAGNVGIGTTSPSSKLTVYSDTTADGILVDVLSRPRITLRDRGNSDTIIGTGDYGLDDFFIDTYSGNALAIKGSTRNVGVGTTSPSQKFVVSNGSAEVFKVYSSGEVIVGTNYIYAAASGNSFYSEAAANFRGVIRNDVGAYLQINGGTSGYTYFSGNVGFGTTNPTSPLEITNTGSAGGGYSMYTSGYSAGKLWGMRKYGIDNGQGIHWSSDVQFSSTWYNAIKIGHGQNATNPSFQSYYTTYLATTGGNVGIGLTTPQKKLDVNGTGIVASFGGTFGPGDFAGIHFGYSESNSNNDSYKKSALVFERTDNHAQGGNASGKIHFLLNNIASGSATSLSHSVMVIDTDAVGTLGSARVGIGTTSPSTKLEVGNFLDAVTNKITVAARYEYEPEFNFRLGQSGTNYDWIGAVISSGDDGNYNGKISFKTANANRDTPTTKMVIKANGNVGIGTTNPNIYGNSFVNQFTVSTTSGYANISVAGAAGSGGGIDFGNQTVRQAGVYSLDGSHLGFYTNGTNTGNGLTERIRILAGGNVGVGTSSPSEKLHVSGAAIFDGGSGNSSTDAVVYITKSTNDDWGLYVNNAGLDYGMYTRTSPSANYAFALHNGTTWTTRITGNAIVYLGEKNAIEGNYDSWLRLNNSNHYTSGVYTPGVMRADGGFQVSGSTVLHTGNYNSYTPTLGGTGASGTWGISITGSAGSATTSSSTYRGIIEDTRAGERTPNDYDDYRVSWEFTNQIPGLNYGGTSWWSVMTMQGWHNGYSAWQIIGSSSSAIDDFYLRAGNNTTWNTARRIWHSGDFTSTNISNWNTAYGWGNHASQGYATTSYVTTQINNLINGAPGALDTLSELASALGNDASFATTVTNSIAGKVSKGGDTITTSNQYGLVIDHSPVLGDFVDALLVRSTTSGQRAQIGFATVDADGDHHRASIRAYKGAGTLEGVFGIALRQAGSGAHVQRLTLDYLGNLTIGGALTESSSFKLKENVQTSEGNLEKVVNLRPVTYNKIGSQTKELGLIAEEVAEVYPEFVQYDENGEPVGVHYSRLTAALIGAVKELTNQVQELNKKING